MKKLEINLELEPQSYEIIIGNDLFPRLSHHLKEKKPAAKYAIITDSTVKKLHGQKLLQFCLEAELDTKLFAFPAGEASKSRGVKQKLEDQLLEHKYGRDSMILALGGGVVGDLAGYVAATYMRGIPYIQIPTTIIAQADSSIGGKTAIDVPQGKNLIGAFHQPEGVYIDVSTLATLDERNYTSGMAEIIKHGIIHDYELFEFLAANSDLILSRKTPDYMEIMTRLLFMNCQVKNYVVAKDSRETNLRKILNYGHTIGHAVELLSGFRLLHGEAVAIGMAAEAFFSYKLGFCSKTDYTRQLSLLKEFKLPVALPREMQTAEIMEALKLDKKARCNMPEFVLVESIGKIKTFPRNKTTTVIEEEKLKAMLQELQARGRGEDYL